MAFLRMNLPNLLAPPAGLRDLEAHLERVFGDRDQARLSWVPSADLRETSDAYVIVADVPGISRDAIDLSVSDDIVTIQGERTEEQKGDGDGCHCRERRYGRFQRSFRIPGGFDAAKVEASCKDGVLQVTVPKREENRPRQIEVK